MTARSTTYPSAVARCNARALRSGAIYDALHLITAGSEGARLFLTFDVEDFRRLAEPGGPRIMAPPDPPGMPSPEAVQGRQNGRRVRGGARARRA